MRRKDKFLMMKKKFHKKERVKTLPYDKETEIPVMRCSICTGERVAGFKNKNTGKFKEIMLIRDDEELKNFMEMYGVDSVKKEY